MVVEDDIRMATATRSALHAAGVVADVTASGNDAIWMALNTSYDVILLDVMLPDIDGFETCSQLRAAGLQTLLAPGAGSCSKRSP